MPKSESVRRADRRVDKTGRLNSGPQTQEEEQEFHDPETGKVVLKWRLVPRDEIRCRAKIRSADNPWRGNQCANTSIPGGTVCRYHGGTLPGVRKAAERRLMLAAEPAARKLIWMALYKKGIDDNDRIKALLAILDRAGISGKTTVEIEVKPWQAVLQKLYNSSADAEGRVIDGELVDGLEEGIDYELEEDAPDIEQQAG